MKRIILLLIIILSVAVCSSCSASKEQETTTEFDDEWITSAELNQSNAKLELVPASESVHAGEEFTVTLKLADCVRFTDMTLNIDYPEEYCRYLSGETVIEGNNLFAEINEVDGVILYSLMSQTTANLNGDCVSIVLAVNDDVPAGTTLDFSFASDCLYSQATDSSGSQTINVTDSIVLKSCTVTVN